jgi:hypothetical protein
MMRFEQRVTLCLRLNFCLLAFVAEIMKNVNICSRPVLSMLRLLLSTVSSDDGGQIL